MLPSRRLTLYWRRALAILLGVDAIWIAAGSYFKGLVEPVAAGAEPWAGDLARSLPALLALAAVAAVCAWRFGRRAGAPWWGLLSMAATWPLIEAHGFVHHDYTRSFFYPGAMTLGWTGGFLFAGGLRRWAGGPRDPEDDERFAGVGAMALLGTTYVSAGIAKFFYTASGWVNPAILRLTVIMENPVGADDWTYQLERLVIDNPDLALELAVATIVVECGAIVYAFGPRLRALSGTTLLAFHLASAALLNIIFLEAIVCLTVFSYPWPLLLDRLRRDARGGEEVEAPARSGLPAQATLGRALTIAGAVMAGVVVLWLVPIGQAAHTPSASDAPVVQRLGPFSVGDEVVPGWRLEAIDPHAEHARLTLAGPDDGRVDLLLGSPDGPVKAGPFDVWPARMAYENASIPWEALEPVATAFAARVREAFAAAGDTNPLPSWLASRPR